MVDTWGYVMEVHKDTIAGLKARIAELEGALRKIATTEIAGNYAVDIALAALTDRAVDKVNDYLVANSPYRAPTT